jgi:hypothetical protein
VIEDTMVSILSVALGVAGVVVVLVVLLVISFIWGIQRERPNAPKNPLAEFIPSLRDEDDVMVDQLGPRIRNLRP